MFKKLMLFAITVMLALPLSGGALAQEADFSEEDLENMDFVAAAFDAVLNLSSYTVEGTTLTLQDIATGSGSGAVSVTQEIEQFVTTQATIDDDGVINSASTIEQIINSEGGGQRINAEMSMDMIVLDGDIYARVYDTTGVLADVYTVEGWFDVMANPEILGLDALLDMDNFTDYATSQFAYPVTPETVTSITELDSEEVDGQTLRVFVIEFDIASLAESGDLDQALGAFSADAFGSETEDFLDAMVAGMEIKMTISIGEDDGLIYTISGNTDINMEFTGELTGGVPLELVQTTIVELAYTGFDVEVTIEAPEIDG